MLSFVLVTLMSHYSVLSCVLVTLMSHYSVLSFVLVTLMSHYSVLSFVLVVLCTIYCLYTVFILSINGTAALHFFSPCVESRGGKIWPTKVDQLIQ